MTYSCVSSQKAIFILLIHALIFLVYFALINAAESSGGGHRRRFSVPLIHRDSVHSPYYNPKDTIADRARHAIQISEARVAYLMNQNTKDINRGGGGDSGGNVSMPMVSDFGAVYVNISIGQPPVPVLLLMDTASAMTWVKCEACRYFSCSKTVFNYYSSSTFAKQTCQFPFCRFFKCVGDSCEFYVRYADGADSQGFIAKETFTFETSDEGTVAVPNMAFGCARTYKEPLLKISGILGLSATSYSFSQLLGPSFSYCVGNIDDPNYSYSHLILGDGAVMNGDSATMSVSDVDLQYFITLERIRIGDTRVPVAIDNFVGTIIDSGTALTYLVDSIFIRLMAEVKKLLGEVKYFESQDYPNMVCFKGSKDTVKGFPVVAFELEGGAELALDSESFFFEIDKDSVCVAVASSPYGKNIIGMIAQQFYNVGYNLGEKKLYLQRIDCQLLQE